MRNDVGKRLKVALVQRDRKQNDVAAAVGMLPDRLSKIFSGNADPRFSEVEKIADALGLAIVFEEKQDEG